MWQKRSLVLAVMLTVVCTLTFGTGYINAQDNQAGRTQGYDRIVVISDLHYPAKEAILLDPPRHARVEAGKQSALAEINQWDDVKKVVFTGDLMGQWGAPDEFAATKKFVAQLQKPKVFITGNHDYLYLDPTFQTKLKRGNEKTETEKLNRFREAFGVQELYHSERIGSYLLVYLSCDELGVEAPVTTQMSRKQLAWFRETLAANRQVPTIIFFHAALVGTVDNYSPKMNQESNIAMPEKEIKKILKENQQVIMWVSGHNHTAPDNQSFCSKINYYEGRVLNVHNDTWDHDTITTNSLYLHPDKVIIRTYNHTTHQWMPEFDRTVPIPIF